MVPAALLIVIVAGLFLVALWLGWENTVGKVMDRIKTLEKNETEDRRKLEEMRTFLDDVILGHSNEARLKRALRRIYATEDMEEEVEDRIRERTRAPR